MTSKINTYKRFTSIFLLIFSLFIGFSNNLSASEPQEHEADANHHDTAHAASSAHAKVHDPNAPVDITAIALEHVADSHSWHLWGEGEGSVALPLPVILYSSTKGLQLFSSAKFEHGHASYNGYRLEEEKIISEDATESFYDVSITKNVAQMLFSAILIFVLFTSIAKSYKSYGVTSAPRGKQSFFEPLITFVRDDIAKGNIGHGSEKYVPYLLTVFFMILINNVFGMIPIGANLTGNIAFTLVLSVATMIVTNINGNKNYWSHIFLPHAPKAIWPILIPIEIVGILTKPFALMIRLFANMTAGHIIVISLIGLIFVFKSIYIAPVSIAFALFIDVLECLVAFLQAYVFTMLTALFIGSAVADHNEDGAHTTDDDHVTSGHLEFKD
ncbi:MAG: F0F1 ATP synthase subunit A [Bacteroidia bacterium]|nr:F0F1 ATP synthase subunit A [Bacteroidia bacterium]